MKDRARAITVLEQEFATAMPTTPRCVQAGGVSISCLAPGRYVASALHGAGLPARLAGCLDGIAAVTDQSDLWAIYAVSGEGVRDVLARVVPIDVDDAQFRVGDVALTRAGHLDVRLWRVAAQDYEIAVTRSVSGDLHYALMQSAR